MVDYSRFDKMNFDDSDGEDDKKKEILSEKEVNKVLRSQILESENNSRKDIGKKPSTSKKSMKSMTTNPRGIIDRTNIPQKGATTLSGENGRMKFLFDGKLYIYIYLCIFRK